MKNDGFALCVSFCFPYSNPLTALSCVQVTFAMDGIAMYSSSSDEEASSDAEKASSEPSSAVHILINDSSASSESSPVVRNKNIVLEG